MTETFGAALAAVLGERGLSQADLRRRLAERGRELTSGAVSQWVTGLTTPSAPTAALVIECIAETEAQRARLMAALVGQAA